MKETLTAEFAGPHLTPVYNCQDIELCVDYISVQQWHILCVRSQYISLGYPCVEFCSAHNQNSSSDHKLFWRVQLTTL